MVTSLNNNPPVQDIGYLKTEQIIRATVTSANVGGAAVVLGAIPTNALVTGGQLSVTTAFNGTTPTINVGNINQATGTATAAAYASAMALGAQGTTLLDDIGLASALPASAPLTITATLPAAAGNTTGSADVLIKFVA